MNAVQTGCARIQARHLRGAAPAAPLPSRRAKMPPSAPLSAPQTSTHISMPWFSGSPANTPKYGLLPATATTRKPAASTPISTSRCQRSTVPRPSSSMAKITPASGALKAAANPPAPAAISSLAWKPRSRRPRRFQKSPQASITAAPTCTDGPSRPMEAPANMPKKASGTFHNA